MANGITSPLGFIANSSIIISDYGTVLPVIEDGRYVHDNTATRYLVNGYLKRSQSSGTDSGEDTDITTNDTTGGNVTSYLYRGYLLGYSVVGSTFQHGLDNEDSLTYQSLGITVPNFISNCGKQRISLRFGDYLMDGYVLSIGGTYGSRGIDEIIYSEISGVPIVLRGSSVNG
jgi:hypothetical protein